MTWIHFFSRHRGITASLLAYQLPHYLWLLNSTSNAESDIFSIAVEVNGEISNHTIHAIDRKALDTRLQAQQTTSASSKPPSKLRHYAVLSFGVGYIKPGPCYNAENPSYIWNETGFAAFIDEAFEHMLANKVNKLILDVRKNPGGTNSFSDKMIAWFENKPFKFASKLLVKSSQLARESNAQRLQDNTVGDSSDSVRLEENFARTPYGHIFDYPMPLAQPRNGKQFSLQPMAQWKHSPCQKRGSR